jgi:hypothetical protein
MEWNICLIFFNFLINQQDTVYLKEHYFVVNNERSCFTCIRPVAEYLSENQDEFHFVNIAREIHALAIYPNFFKDEKFSSFCKNEVKMLYMVNGIAVDTLHFSHLNRNLPLIIVAKDAQFSAFEFEHVFGRGKISQHAIRKKFRRMMQKSSD